MNCEVSKKTENLFHNYPENLQEIRNTEFSRTKDAVYLDHAGSTLYSKSQIDQYTNDLQENLYGNPHSANISSNLMSDTIHQIRCVVLSHFNVTLDDYDVVFVSGSTGALKILADSFTWTQGKSKFVYLEDNHTSVVGIREVAAEHGASSLCLTTSLPCDTHECFSLSSFKATSVKDCSSKKTEEYCQSVNHLFAYPAQSNFSGYKYPLRWIEEVASSGIPQLVDPPPPTTVESWSVLLDAASFAVCSPLDLRKYSPDFACVSFYKLFGFPTGLGALLVKQSSIEQLSNKSYFGGGTADGYLAREDFYKPKTTLHDRLEDGTLPFLDILALKHGFDSMNRIINRSMSAVRDHTFSLARRLYEGLTSLRYSNGSSVVQVYSLSNYTDSSAQGPIVTLNVKRSNGRYEYGLWRYILKYGWKDKKSNIMSTFKIVKFLGFNHVLHLAASCNIHLRAGCFCNIGGCASMLHLHAADLKKAYEEGHTCGGNIDLLNGKPLGAIRASLGYMSTRKDVDALIQFFKDCFLMVDDVDSKVLYNPLPYLPTDQEIYLKEIFLYPVKSCRAIKVSEWMICETGLKYDRLWMAVNAHGVCLTLKREQKLTLIQPFINLKNMTLSLKAEGFGSVTIPIEESTREDSEAYHTKVCGDRILGTDCGEEVRRWLTEVLGQPASLIRKRSDAPRFVKLKSHSLSGCSAESDCDKLPSLALANEAQFLLVSFNTVEHLRNVMMELDVSQDYLHVEDQNTTTLIPKLDVDTIVGRFRCNFLIVGTQPFTEERWSDVFVDTVGEAGGSKNGCVHFHCTGLCNRCSAVSIDQTTGERSVEPLRTLGKLPPTQHNSVENHKHSQRRNNFGVYLSTDASNSLIRIGAGVVVKNKS